MLAEPLRAEYATRLADIIKQLRIIISHTRDLLNLPNILRELNLTLEILVGGCDAIMGFIHPRPSQLQRALSAEELFSERMSDLKDTVLIRAKWFCEEKK